MQLFEPQVTRSSLRRYAQRQLEGHVFELRAAHEVRGEVGQLLQPDLHLDAAPMEELNDYRHCSEQKYQEMMIE